MASNLLRLDTKTITTPNPATPFSLTKTQLSFPSTLLNKPKTPYSLSPLCSLTPPNSKEAAIQQAKTCLTTTLEKPLNNLRLTSKLKKLKQPRFRIELPLADDSPESLSHLALLFFKDLPIKRKGSPVNILVLWPDTTSAQSAVKAFMSSSPTSTPVEHLDVSSVANGNTRISNTADVAVFLAPEKSLVAVMKTVAEAMYPKPVVMFNPKWGNEEEEEAEFGELSGFVGSFEVIYSFMGLEVKGLLSKRNGVVFKCVRNGVVSGEKWAVLVEEEQGELKVVSTFKTRPSIADVEYVLYNLMAMNSPVTNSVKFFRDLVSNVTGKK